MRNYKIIDAFPFNGEFDMLRMRLDYLYNGVITPIINYGLQTVGVNHILSFLIPNLAHLGYHVVTAIPLGKAFGLIKEHKDYNEIK